MMRLTDLISRLSPPIPWEEGDNIPWNEPGFSRRMLREHLSQEHDAASRRFEIIDQQVEWIHSTLLNRQPGKILDLACGPGLYAERFARLGHTCIGIDYSPASIEYAVSTAQRDNLSCSFVPADIRRADYPRDMRLVMLIYGEFNVFRPSDAKAILMKAWQALDSNGWLLLEPHPYEVVHTLGKKPPRWYTSPAGLFSDQPHLILQENFWDESLHTATMRYYAIDAQSGEITRYAQSMQAYQDDEYRALLSSLGFKDVRILPGLTGETSTEGLFAIVGQKD